MSYIRPTTNLEGLYIYTNSKGVIIRWNDGDTKSVVITEEEYNGILDLYINADYEIDDKLTFGSVQMSCAGNGYWQYILRFTKYDLELVLWDVTLDYLVKQRLHSRRMKNIFYWLYFKLFE